MDYVRAPLLFHARKALRYIRLYGPSRTLAKIRGHYHMKKQYAELPTPRERNPRSHVGLLGCGNFAFSNIAYYLHKQHPGALRAAMDIDINKAASLYETYGLDYYTDDASRILDDPKIDLIYIASNHASHAEYAIEALKRDKSVHIEKPHAVTMDQLERLCSAMATSKGRVGLGFNRPSSRIGKLIQASLAAESGPAMLNWFVAGHEISPDHWYHRPGEGGRVLGNLCHWTDFIYQLVEPQDRYPITINPTRAERSDCDIAVTFTFGNGTIAIITFSAKGPTFEGVRERFAAHRGSTLIFMDDFHQLTIETVARKRRLDGLFRDHGHCASIMRSYEAACSGAGSGALPISYIWEAGELFLRTKEALENNRPVTIGPFAGEVGPR